MMMLKTGLELGRSLDEVIKETGGSPWIRDIHLLESAVAIPQANFMRNNINEIVKAISVFLVLFPEKTQIPDNNPVLINSYLNNRFIFQTMSLTDPGQSDRPRLTLHRLLPPEQ